MLQNFLRDLRSLWQLILTRQKSALLKVVGIELVSIGARLGALLIFAGGIYCLRYEINIDLLGFQIELGQSIELIVFFGVAIGLLGVIDTHSSYSAFKISRSLGRNACEYAQTDTLDYVQAVQSRIFISQKNSQSITIEPRNLTQIPLHTGLSHQSLALLINPIITIIALSLTIIIVDYKLALLVLLLSLPLIPISISQSKKSQSNAALLYGKKAADMGRSSSKLLNLCLSQSGSYDRRTIINDWLRNDPSRKSFLDSLDTNLLAVRELGNKVGIFAAIIRGIIFIVACLFYFIYGYSVEKLIVLMGALSLLFSAARNSIAILSKLSIYRPQLKVYLQLFHLLKEHEQLEPTTNMSIPQDCSITQAFTSNRSIDREESVSLFEIIARATNAEQDKAYYVGSGFRFVPEQTLWNHLCGGNISQDRQAEVKKLINALFKFEVFCKPSQDDLQTTMDESMWKNLNPFERLLIRLGGLIHKKNCTILIDARAIKSLGVVAPEFIKIVFPHNHIVIIHSSTDTIFDTKSARHIVIEDNKVKNFHDDFGSFLTYTKDLESQQQSLPDFINNIDDSLIQDI